MLLEFSLRMPWQPLYVSGVNCTTKEHLDSYMNRWKGVSTMDEVRLYNLTGCQAPCTRWEYSSTTVMRKDKAPPRGTDPRLNMDLFYANGNYNEKQQYYTYGLNDLFSDFGGYMGLFLGASMLTFYDAVASLLDMFKKIVVTKKANKSSAD